MQGLRGLAVALVVAHHASLPVPGGYLGVDVFFVISGFVITGVLLKRFRPGHTGKELGDFFRRRFWRLGPALAGALIFTALAGILFLSPLGPLQSTLETGIASVFLLSNVYIELNTGGYFDTDAKLNGLLNTWSLSVEEQFYLLFPIVVLVALALISHPRLSPISRRRLLLIGTAAVCVVSFGLSLIDYGVDNPFLRASFGFYGPLGRAWEFGLGSMAAQISLEKKKYGKLLQFIGLAAILLSAFNFDETIQHPGPLTLIPTLGAFFFIIGGVSPNGGLLKNRMIVSIGNLSYSLYLYHWPLIVFSTISFPGSNLALMAAVIVSFVFAYLSHRFVEKTTLRHSSEKLSMDEILRATLVIVAPVSILLGVLLLANHGFGSRTVAEAIHSRELPGASIQPHDCFEDVLSFGPGGQRPPCVYHASLTGVPVYLVGDSNAGHFAEGIILAGSEIGRPITVATGCRWSPLFTLDGSARSHQGIFEAETFAKYCSEGFQKLEGWVLDAKPGTVIVSNSDHYWISHSVGTTYGNWLVGMDGSSVTSIAQEKLTLFEEGLMTSVERLKAAGHKVILVQTVPHFEATQEKYRPELCSISRIIDHSCFPSASRTEIDALQGDVRDILEKVGHSMDVKVVDFSDEVCGLEGPCEVYREGFHIYRDGHHISNRASRTLTQSWVSLLTEQ